MTAASTGYWASAPSFSPASHPGTAYLSVASNGVLDFYWTFGSKLTLGSTGRTLPTSFEIFHRGSWDLLHAYGPPGPYTLYRGLYLNASSPNGYGTQGMFNAGLARHEWWQNLAGPGGSEAEVWIRARVQRSGLVDWPGLYTQPTKLTVTISEL